ncbi:Acyl-CoA thioesterase 8 [Actinomortierella ambigua]|nr:Acyl-CoA thioesterase 8 [Actinomortierella ambigua]
MSSTASETPAPQKDTVVERMLDLEEIDTDLYRSKTLWVPMGARGVFGGQVVGQALVAATKTVAPEYSVHVKRVRDGKSYCTRTVTAKQRGKAIFTCTASYQVPRPNALSHQYPMPDVPHHSTLSSQEELIKAMLKNPKVPENFQDMLKLRLDEPIALDFKDTRKHSLKDITEPPKRTQQTMWIKAKGSLGNDLALHQCVVAYGSDHNLLNTVPLAYGATWFTPKSSDKPRIGMMASLDHSMWFHCPFRADEWMLYVCESPRSGCDRGLTFGRIYKEDGTLAVSVAQEGVVRLNESKKETSKL